MKKLLLILSLLLITTNIYADYTLYGKNVDDDILFYDRSTVKRIGNKVKVWRYMNFGSDDYGAKSLNMSSARLLDEINLEPSFRQG